MAFYVIKYKKIADAALIPDHPDDIGVKAWEFSETMPLLERFKANSRYQMDNKKSKRRVLHSWVKNLEALPIISLQLKDNFKNAIGSDFEFLPITILNQRGKVESTEYFIAHPLSTIDAVDLEKSEYKNDPFDPETFQTWNKVILIEEKIPHEIEIFRLKQIVEAIIVSDSLKERIEADDTITGIEFIPIDKFTSRSI